MALHDSYLECFTCGKSFVHATTLREHEDYSCQARVLFVCIPCGLTFDSSWFLDQHIIRHKRGGSLLFTKEELNYEPTYKCDQCKTPFISRFTLSTHQLYSCPATVYPDTCAFVVRNPSEGITTYSEDEQESSEDEGKLKIVENGFESQEDKILRKKISTSKNIVEKANNANKVEDLKNLWKNRKENLENIWEINAVGVNYKDKSGSSKVSQPEKDLKKPQNFGKSKENGLATGKVLKNTSKESQLISNTFKDTQFLNNLRSSTDELPGIELCLSPNSSNSKGQFNEAILSNSVEEEREPLKMVLKIKNPAEMTALPVTTNPINPENLSNATTTNAPNLVHNHTTTITAIQSSTTQKPINDTAINANKYKGVQINSSCVNNDVIGKEKGNEVDGKCFGATENALKVFKKDKRNFKPKTYPCSLCGRCFVYPETRACHENMICCQKTTAKGHEIYTCSKCHFVLASSNDFDLHTVMKCCPKAASFNTCAPSPVSCQYCARQYVQESTLETHLDLCCTVKTAETNGRNLAQIVTNPNF